MTVNIAGIPKALASASLPRRTETTSRMGATVPSTVATAIFFTGRRGRGRGRARTTWRGGGGGMSSVSMARSAYVREDIA
jgi:hypothetical protein